MKRRIARIHPAAFLLLLIAAGMSIISQPGNLTVAANPLKPAAPRGIQPAAGSMAGTIFDHVVIIMMENEGVFNICLDSPPPCSTTKAPYMAGLANNYTVGSQYLSLINTSQPNYVAMISGSMQGCNSSGCPSPITAPNLVDRFEAAGLTWKAYMENQTARGCDISSPEPYTPIHNPFIVFQDITNNTSRCNKIIDANPKTCGTIIDCALVSDLNNATIAAPNFMWLTPNDCNDMRGNSVCTGGCGVVNGTCIPSGDAYLSKLVPNILTSRTFTTSRSALFITFDEGNGFCPLNQSTEDCMYASWSGPVAKTKFGSTNMYNHYSVTKTIETNWNLPSFTSNDANANAMTEFFKNQPADFTIKANPSSLVSPVGSKSNSTITLASINNFTGTLTLSATSQPSGPSLTLNPTSVTLTAQGTKTSTLTFTSTITGNYTATVRATNGTVSHNTNITVSVVPPDFSLSTTPSSLTFGQLSSTAGSSVLVNSTGDRTFFESSYLQSSFYANGLIWLFYEDTRSTCEHETGCLYYTTSTNGTHWTPPTKVPVHVTDSDFSVHTNGTSVFYVRYNETSYDSNCGRNIQFGLGTLNTSGSITWQPERIVAVGAMNRAYPDDEITVDSNGQVWIAYLVDSKSSCGGTGTERPWIIHSAGTDYGSWLGNMTLCLAACHSLNWHIALASLGSGEIYSLYWVSRFGVHGRLFNGTVWGSEETISSDGTDVNNWLFNSGTNIYAIYFDNLTETYNFAARSSIGAWTVNLIGAAETHSGILAFSPSYYSLPDAASYDSKDNLFDLFYMNATNQRIDQWSGFGSSWTLTTGIVSIAPVPYSDSISSFIQSSTMVIGSIFYISGSTSFTINSVSISFTPAGNTGTFKVTIGGKYGFSSTVNISTTISPASGLTVSCSPASIPGGTGSSTCNLTATTKGNYTVTVTATNGTITHIATVRVTVLAFPDYTITISQPSPADAGQSSAPTITITELNQFSGIVTLTANAAIGLTCSTITPGSITGSGSATLSCTSSSAANYTLTVTGTSGSLTHNANVTFRFQDFTISATVPPSPVGSAAAVTVTVLALNGFTGTISLADTVPTGESCGSVTPNSLAGSGTANLICTGMSAGNYTLSITGSSSPLAHTAGIIIQVTDFTLDASPATFVLPIGTNGTSTITITSMNGFSGSVSLSGRIQTVLTSGGSAGGRRGFEMLPLSSSPELTLSPATVVVSRGVSGQSTLTIILSLGVQSGNYSISLAANHGSLIHTMQLKLSVTDFSISSPPSSVTIRPGDSTTMSISLQSINGFTGNLTLTTTVSPSGPSGTLNPNVLQLRNSSNSSLLTIVVPSNTPPGNYMLSIQATAGTLSHTVSITITVPAGFTTAFARIFSPDQLATVGLVFASGTIGLLLVRVGATNIRWKSKLRTGGQGRRIQTGKQPIVLMSSFPITLRTLRTASGILED